ENERVDVVAGASDRGSDFAARAEGRVETAVRVVANERQVVGAADGRVTRRHELPVGLADEGGDAVVAGADRSGHLAARPEGRIETAVRIVAHDGEGGGGAVARRRAGRAQLAVGLEHQ